MKAQDLLFIIATIGLFFLALQKIPLPKKVSNVTSGYKIFVIAALLCILLSIPLFSAWVFFTAQRLLYYAGILLIIGVGFYVIVDYKKQK